MEFYGYSKKYHIEFLYSAVYKYLFSFLSLKFPGGVAQFHRICIKFGKAFFYPEFPRVN